MEAVDTVRRLFAGGRVRPQLQAWLEQVEHELLPRHPPEALSLAEAFIQAD